MVQKLTFINIRLLLLEVGTKENSSSGMIVSEDAMITMIIEPVAITTREINFLAECPKHLISNNIP